MAQNRNEKLIDCFYELSNRLSECLKIKFQVDHILPLSKGGTHHENNLQVLPARFNSAKCNRIEYECLYPTFKKPKI